jgi:hypothetical protein
METKLTVERIMRLIIGHYGGPRVNIFIPNVSWGYFKTHEADLLMISKQGYLTEFEIKRSYSDFLADFKKAGTHFEGKVAHLYYVVPESIKDKCWAYLVEHEFPEPYTQSRFVKGRPPVGLMYYMEDCGVIFEPHRAPHLARYTHSNDNDYKLYLEEQIAIMRLGCLRIWNKPIKEPEFKLE